MRQESERKIDTAPRVDLTFQAATLLQLNEMSFVCLRLCVFFRVAQTLRWALMDVTPSSFLPLTVSRLTNIHILTLCLSSRRGQKQAFPMGAMVGRPWCTQEGLGG